MKQNHNKLTNKQHGSVLIISLIILVAMTLIGITAMRTSVLEEKMAGNVKPGCKLLLQPEWSKAKEMLPQIISYVKSNPQWEISLQIHKFMDIP